MKSDIVFRGKFSLRYKTFVGEHKLTTHDIEIVKWYECSNKPSCYTIASWDKDHQLVSCGDRLLEAITNNDDLEDVKMLAKIGALILETQEEVLDWNE